MIKFFKKLRNIIEGGFKRIFNFDSKLSRKRLEICDKCPHKTKILSDAYCDLCGCALKSKSMVEDETCYDGRWDDIKINENEKGKF